MPTIRGCYDSGNFGSSTTTLPSRYGSDQHVVGHEWQYRWSGNNTDWDLGHQRQQQGLEHGFWGVGASNTLKAWVNGNNALFSAGTDATNPFTVTVSGAVTV